MSVNIVGLNKADVLAALYNASRPQGMGFMHYQSEPMKREEAEQLLQKTQYFDYLKGRVMKTDLKRDNEFDEWGYDRDNGQGAAQAVIDALRANDQSKIKDIHKNGVMQSAASAHNQMHQPTRKSEKDGIGQVNLGLEDVADVLKPKVQSAKEANR